MDKTREDMISSIRSYLFESFLLGFSSDDFPDDRSFYEAGVLDSIGVIEIVSYIEQNFDITFDNNEIVPENVSTINQIADFITQKKSPIGA